MNEFKYKNDIFDWNKKERGEEIVKQIEYLFTFRGTEEDGIYTLKDPDGTFVLSYRPEGKIMVLLDERETKGRCVLWYDYKKGLKVLTPGPWINRIQLLTEEVY